MLSAALTPIKWESFVKSKICSSAGLIIKKLQLPCSWALHISSAQKHIQIFWFICYVLHNSDRHAGIATLFFHFRHAFFTHYHGQWKFSFFSDTHCPYSSASLLTPSNFVVLYFWKIRPQHLHCNDHANINNWAIEYMRAILSFHSFLSPMELIIIFVTLVGKTKSKLLELLLPTKMLNQSRATNLKKSCRN